MKFVNRQPFCAPAARRPAEDGIRSSKPQQPFAGRAADLPTQRNPRRKFDEPVVEVRYTRLETDCHRGTIHFDEKFVGQIRDQIEVHHAVGELRQERSWPPDQRGLPTAFSTSRTRVASPIRAADTSLGPRALAEWRTATTSRCAASETTGRVPSPPAPASDPAALG